MDLKQFKMRTTPTHVYFWGGPFSQWFKSSFTAELPVFRAAADGKPDRIVRSGVPLVFSSAEKYMMAAKASVFGDTAKGGALEKIMGSEVLFGETDWKADGYLSALHDVRLIKQAGREVPGFNGPEWDAEDIAFWDRVSVPVVTIGTLAKFSQSDALFEVLVSMEDKTFVEGSPHDDLWGVKLSWDDPRIEDTRNWRGKNKLGKILNVATAIFSSQGRDIEPWHAYAQSLQKQPAHHSSPAP